MENKTCKLLQAILLLLVLNFIKSTYSSISDAAIKEKSNLQTYIVLLEKLEGTEFTKPRDLHNWHQSFLPANTLSSDQSQLVHSYHHVVTGFAAKLTANEAKAMKKRKGVVLTRPERMIPLHTTHTPSFLGLDRKSVV